MRATLAVILARGLGSRLRRDDGAALDAEQAAAAETGVKGLMPVAGRPLLDYALHALADGGVRDVVFVVAPGDSALKRRYAEEAPPSRLRVRFAVQDEPSGTAQALLAARDAVCAPLGASADAAGARHFLMCNADNLYSAAAIEALVDMRGPDSSRTMATLCWLRAVSRPSDCATSRCWTSRMMGCCRRLSRSRRRTIPCSRLARTGCR